ncbi:MAG: hypothetical protein HDR15_11890 [Lachnospiraceae bacterium]|nr:hypothetical protein [Lachnospiraceae bacterium]
MDIQKMVSAYQTMEKVLQITVNGDSMRPALNSGDKLWIHFARRRPRLGEIVLFYTGSGYVVHRVVKRLKSGRLVTKGDGNYMWDGTLIREDDVAGFAETECRSRVLAVCVAHLSYWEGKWNALAYNGGGRMRRPILLLSALFRHLYQQILKHI